MAAVLEIPVMFGYTRIAKKISSGWLLLLSAVAFVIKTYFYYMASNLVMFYVAQAMQLFSFAIFASASVYYAEECMEERDKVQGQAYMSTTIVLGTVIGNMIGGWALDLWGIKVMLLVALGIVVCGTIIAGFAVMKGKAGVCK